VPGLDGKALTNDRVVTWPDPAVEAYRDLLVRLDSWFADASARNPGIIPCRSGCSACCHGPFDVSVADALLVKNAVAGLPAGVRADIQQRAELQVALMREREPGWQLDDGLAGIAEGAFDRIAESMGDQPCPLLDAAGACLIYRDRPMICRMMGLGILTPAGRVIENACPISGEFPRYQALMPQLFDLEAMEELEVASLEAASLALFSTPARPDFETTIALAIVRTEE
jgi:Fe-S-cluster containining protein